MIPSPCEDKTKPWTMDGDSRLLLFTIYDVEVRALRAGMKRQRRGGIFETRRRVVRKVCVYAMLSLWLTFFIRGNAGGMG